MKLWIATDISDGKADGTWLYTEEPEMQDDGRFGLRNKGQACVCVEMQGEPDADYFTREWFRHVTPPAGEAYQIEVDVRLVKEQK